MKKATYRYVGMVGHLVSVVRRDAPTFEGTLIHKDLSGVIVHNRPGFTDDRRFIPMVQIIEIIDKGRTP